MTWDTTTPSGSDQRSDGASNIRTTKTDLQTALKANNATLGDEGVFPGPNPATVPAYRYRGLKGTTAQRPAAGNYGLYYNTTTGTLQRDNGTSWDDITSKPRINIYFGGEVSLVNQGYLGRFQKDPLFSGYVMHRGGSIIGYSVGGRSTSYPGVNVPVNFEIRKNNSNILTAPTLTWTASDQNQDTRGIIASGVHTFAAGDRLQILVDYLSAGANVSSRAMLELELDT